MYFKQDKDLNYKSSNSVNTLAHYIAMKDQLYCCNIYQQFALNPLCREKSDKIDEMKNFYGSELLSNSLRHYLEDVSRVFNVNIFKVEIYENSRQLSEEEIDD